MVLMSLTMMVFRQRTNERRHVKKEASTFLEASAVLVDGRKAPTNNLVRCRHESEYRHEGSGIFIDNMFVRQVRYRGQPRQHDRIFHQHNFFDAGSGEQLTVLHLQTRECRRRLVTCISIPSSHNGSPSLVFVR